MKKVKRKKNILRLILVILIAVLIIALIGLGVVAVIRHFTGTPKEEEIVEVEPDEIKLTKEEQGYADANPKLSKEEVKKRVAMNLDKDPYTDMKPVPDTESMLQLVNKYYYLEPDYVPYDLAPVSSSGENGIVYMRLEAAEAFEEMVAAAAEEGFILNACSAFRSYDEQNELFSNGEANYGLEYADAYWTRPGSSEHQSGLGVDIRMDNDFSDLDAVRYNEHYDWLLDHMADYGFILRYPDDKEDYTRIAPESWHLRYVGKDAAKEIYKNNWCLEEYWYYKKLY